MKAPEIKVIVIDSIADAEPVRELMRNFVRWHLEQHVEDKS